MSDCSTNAWKTPACPEHKTCGNCGRSERTNVFCRLSDGTTAGLHSIDERACKRWVAGQNRPDVSHESDSAPDVSLERYERLAQVAREMYAALHINEHCSMEFIPDRGDCGSFRDQLEALGVSVDE